MEGVSSEVAIEEFKNRGNKDLHVFREAWPAHHRITEHTFGVCRADSLLYYHPLTDDDLTASDWIVIHKTYL